MRDVTAKQFIQTVFGSALRRSIVVSPAVNGRDDKFSVDVVVPGDRLRAFGVVFLATIGVRVEDRNGVDYFEKKQLESATDTKDKADSDSVADGSTSLRELSRVSDECWVVWMEKPRYSMSCLDGETYYDTDFFELKPKVNWQRREVDIAGVRYRNKTPATFFARLQKQDVLRPILAVSTEPARPNAAGVTTNSQNLR